MKEMVKYELFYKKNESTPVAKIFGKVSPKIAADITKILIDIDFKDFPNFIKDGILRYREKLDRNRNRLHLPLFELSQKYFEEKINSPVGNTKLYHKLHWYLPDILTKDHKLHWYLSDILTKGDRVPHEYLENLVNDLTNYGFQITMDSGGISIEENELLNLMQYLGTSKYMDLIISDTIFEKVSDNTPVSVARYRVILFFSFCSFVSKNIFNKDTLIFKKIITNRKDLDDFLLDIEDKK